ncbi:MAG: BrnT family toxin [Acidobacteria bacterium]|nr:BrnT family toxin [Acidobacteriota bacterium]
MGFLFEWDQRKAAANLKKHGVSFPEATTVFRDPLSITISDPDRSDSESRFVDLGLSHRGRLLVVSYIERGDYIRIISARCASRSERRQYEGKLK